jgi:hypothetical protein
MTNAINEITYEAALQLEMQHSMDESAVDKSVK